MVCPAHFVVAYLRLHFCSYGWRRDKRIDYKGLASSAKEYNRVDRFLGFATWPLAFAKRIPVAIMSFGSTSRRRRESGLVETWIRVSYDADEDMAMQRSSHTAPAHRYIYYGSNLFFQVFVLRFSKFHFIMIDWIMKFLWFCPHGFCVFSLSFHMHEGVCFGQVAFILRPEYFCLVDRQILKTK